VIETRTLKVMAKRFTRDDLLGIAALILKEAELAQQAGKRCRVEFTLRCADGTTYSGEDLSHLSEGAEIDLKPPAGIEFEFTDYERERRIDFDLKHGGGYTDGLTIRGTDRDWVRGLFTGIGERVNAVAPLSSWFTRHPTITFFCLALGIGSMIDLGIGVLINEGLIPRPDPSNPIRVFFLQISEPIQFCVTWASRYGMGLPFGLWGRNWVLSAWPPVELDIGPEHGKEEKLRRERLKVFFILGVAPVLVAVVYDLLKLLI
jgi:hypothetical protein